MSLPFLPAKFFHWTKVLGKFVSIQLVVQALTIASGLFLVRTLEQREYAYYTIANSMLSTMNILADSGISIALSALGGKVWQDRYRFGQLINTAMRFRYYLAVIAITVITPILIWMLVRNGASIGYTVLLTIVVILGLNFQLTNGVLIVVPRLYSQISRVQNLDIVSAISRLIFIGLGYLTFWNGIVAIASASLASALQCFILGRWAGENIDKQVSSNSEDSKYIFTTIKHSLPSSIFFCIQGQISVFLISIFGSTQNIAELGALGRITVIFSIINSVMNTIVLPSFSRCQSVVILRRRYFQILGLFLSFGIGFLTISYIFPEQILWIIGEKYSHLKQELFMVIMVTVVSYFVSLMSSFNFAKGWIQHIWIDIPLTLILQVILLINIDISTIKGVIIFSLFSNTTPFLVNGILTYRGMANYAK